MMISRKGIWSFAAAGALALGGVAGFSRAADEPYTETASSISVQASSGAAAPAEPPAVEEPFVSPVGALKGRIVSRFGQRRVPGDPVKLEMGTRCKCYGTKLIQGRPPRGINFYGLSV